MTKFNLSFRSVFPQSLPMIKSRYKVNFWNPNILI